MCKHIHLVCLHEQRSGSDSGLGDVVVQLSLEKPSEIKMANSEEIHVFIKRKRCENDDTDVLDRKATREAKHETVNNYLRSLDDEEFDR